MKNHFGHIMRKRRMPDEKIAEIVSEVNFHTVSSLWMPQLEHCFHRILKYEYYLNSVPDNLALPKYRKLVVRLIFRLLSQVHPSKLDFSKEIDDPDPIIGDFMEYLVKAEINRKQRILDDHPITETSIRSALINLKREHEI